MKISLFLMTFKGLKALESLVKANKHHLIEFVVIGKDAKVLKDYSGEMKSLCQKENIPFFFRNEQTPPLPNFIITISWRWIIRDVKSQIIVLHESLLPKYRGFAPLVNQLICGEERIGVSAIFGEKDYDTGEIIGQKSLELTYPVKIQEVIEKISPLYQELILEIFSDIEYNGRITTSKPQKEEEATYSLWRDEEDYRINWKQDSSSINRFINAVGHPYKGAFALLNGKAIRIQMASPVEDRKMVIRDVGKVVYFDKEKPVVVCGEGLIRIDEASLDESNESIFPLKKFRSRFT